MILTLLIISLTQIGISMSDSWETKITVDSILVFITLIVVFLYPFAVLLEYITDYFKMKRRKDYSQSVKEMS